MTNLDLAAALDRTNANTNNALAEAECAACYIVRPRGMTPSLWNLVSFRGILAEAGEDEAAAVFQALIDELQEVGLSF